MAEVARDTNAHQRQRRRKKRISRETEDYANENLESPSSLPERVPLQEVVEGEKSGVQRSASNNSGDQEGSSGVHQSTVERRSRPRRPRRRSRLENGDVMYDEEMESKTLDLSERRRHKRPSSGVRHTRRSASAEMIDRDDDDMRGFENTSPTRRRQRRRKAHSSKDIVNGGEYSPDLEGYDGPRDPNMARQKKQKTKKSQRQHMGTSAEEDNYNADVDGEVSLVDYYKVDKEDIVTTNTAPDSAPPALPPVAQTLPSQPLDVLFIERRDGHGFTRERKTRLAQMEEDRKQPQAVSSSRQMTTAEFAVSVHHAFRSFSLFCHGLLAGLALCQVIFVYSLSNNATGDSNLLENYHKLAQPIHSLYYMLFAICTVSVFDRYNMANPRSGFFHGLLTRPSRILSISAYLFALVFSISVANIDDRISLYKENKTLWDNSETTSLLDTWRIINLMRALGAVLGWVLVAAQPTKDYTAQNLYEEELMPREERHEQNNEAV